MSRATGGFWKIERAHVAVEQRCEIVAKPDIPGMVEAAASRAGRDRFGRRLLAEQHRSRVAGDDQQQAERDHDHSDAIGISSRSRRAI